MSYNPGTPQPPDIPADSEDEFLSNFQLLNQFFAVDHVPFGNTVTFATNANPCICTSPSHGLTTGNTVDIVHFGSLIGDQIQLWDINGGPYTATVIDANTFSINADASANPPYLADTGAFSSSAINYGFHKRNFFPTPLSQGPNLATPYSSYFTKNVNKTAEFFFKNGVGTSFEKQMTNLELVEVNNANGKGVKTPWGVIMNFGQVNYSSSGAIYDYPIPYNSNVWSVTGTIQLNTKLFISSNLITSAISLTQFRATAIVRTTPFILLKNVPGYYFAIGV